ncbi:MAG: hypothetical protein SGJ27_11900 [Candidatus Melainabacteria bacterium]|nr:hypothetical protein [Candidatus Melainabacteria bacterium]
MTIDISFRPADTNTKESTYSDFKAHFDAREYYECDDELEEFIYEHGTSAFMFMFEGPMSTQLVPEQERSLIDFSMSFVCDINATAPIACAEIQELVKKFNLLYNDPQFHDHPRFVAFSEADFLASLAESAKLGQEVAEELKAQGIPLNPDIR